jgi:hypothetical protein
VISKAFATRLRRIEERVASKPGPSEISVAEAIRERRRKRAEETGQPYVDTRLRYASLPKTDSRGRRWSVGERIRMCREFERNAATSASGEIATDKST